MARSASAQSHAPPEQASRPSVFMLPLLTVLAMVPVVFSALFFADQSLRLDEAQSLWQTSRLPSEILTVIGRDVHVPLYHLLLHFWRVLFGDTVEIARLMSLLFYVVSIPAIYLLGKLAYSRSIGLFAALLFAISPFMNWYGNEIRMYTLFTLLVILNQYCYLRILKKESDHAWVGYAFTALLGFFSHYFFLLILASQAAFFLLRRALFPPHAAWRFLTAWLFVLILFAPWALFVWNLGEVINQQPILQEPTTVNLFGAFSQFLFGFQEDHLNTIALSLWPVAIILGFLALRRSEPLRYETEYFLLTVLLSVCITFVASFVLRPIFVSRYLIFTIPSLYLLLTALIPLYSRRLAYVVGGGVVIAMLASLTLEVVNPATPVKENYREAASYLTEYAAPQDIVLVTPPFTIYPVEYYYRGTAPLSTLPAWDRLVSGPLPQYSAETLPQEIERSVGQHQRLFVLMSYDQGYEEELRLYLDTNYERLLHKNFSPELDLFVYKLRYDTPLSDSNGPLPL